MKNISRLRTVCFKDEEHYGKIPFISRRLIHPYISIYITWLLLKIGFTGLQATVLMLVTNIIALIILFIGGNLYYSVAGILLLLGWILDHVDGEVCRYRRESTGAGIFLDNLTHRITYPGMYLLIGYSLFRDSGEFFYLYMGIIASYFFSLTVATRLDKKLASNGRDDVVYSYSSLEVAIENLHKRRKGFFTRLIKYFVGMIMSGYGETFDVLLILSSLTGCISYFFLSFSMIVCINFLLIFIFDWKFTFLFNKSNRTEHP